MKMLASATAVLIACSSSLWAQWPKYKEPGVPRDVEGRALMEAPPPRTPDGKPDLSGNWLRAARDPLPQELAGVVLGAYVKLESTARGIRGGLRLLSLMTGALGLSVGVLRILAPSRPVRTITR